MSKNSFKNRMDNIPQDFDSELLWDKISNSKKDRRSAWWVFFLGGGVFVLIIGLGIWYNNKEISPSKIITEKEDLSNQVVLNDIINKDNNSQVLKQDVSKMKLKNSNDDDRPSQFENKSTVQKLSIENINRDDSNSNNGAVERSNQAIKKSNLTDLNNDRIENKINYRSAEIKNVEPVNKVIVLKESSDDHLEIALNKLALTKPLVQYNNEAINLTNDSIEIIVKKAKKNSIQIFAGLSYDFHRFDERFFELKRENFEHTLVSAQIGLNLERSLSRHIFIEAMLSFTRSQTNFDRTERNATWTFVEGQNPSENWSATRYNLYNDYYRLDVALSFGYKFYLGPKSSLKPSIGIAYNISSTQNGHVLNKEYELVTLAERDEYGRNTILFGIATLKYEKTLNPHLVVGGSLSSQTKRYLANSNSKTHTINPVSGSLFIGLKF